MDQLLYPETDTKHQFLDPETVKNVSFWSENFWIQKMMLWISFGIQKLALLARGTISEIIF